MRLGSPEEAIPDSSCALRAQDKGSAPAEGTVPRGAGTLRSLCALPVPYEIFRADHSCVAPVLPVNAAVRDVLRALAPRLRRDREHVLVKVNSAGGEGTPGAALSPCPAGTCPRSMPAALPCPQSERCCRRTPWGCSRRWASTRGSLWSAGTSWAPW